MSYNGMIHFQNSGLDTIQSQTANQQQRYVEIWGNVTRSLMELVNAGQVDRQIGGVLQERDQVFRSKTASYDESVMSQQTAMRNVQNIGTEGGAAMVRAASGGRA
jgi:hypothetical protein